MENAPVRRPNGDGEIHPLSGLLFCKDCGAKMHIRIDYRNGGKRHVAFCSEYHKGKAKNPKCHSPHIMDADLLMQTIAEVLKKIEDYSISNRAEFEVLVKKNLAMQQTDQTKKQQKRIPQITTRLEQIDKVLNKLYEDNALGTIPQDRYEQMSQKYSEEYYALKAELATLQEQLSAYEYSFLFCLFLFCFFPILLFSFCHSLKASASLRCNQSFQASYPAGNILHGNKSPARSDSVRIYLFHSYRNHQR